MFSRKDIVAKSGIPKRILLESHLLLQGFELQSFAFQLSFTKLCFVKAGEFSRVSWTAGFGLGVSNGNLALVHHLHV
jgi:hypothetical protein